MRALENISRIQIRNETVILLLDLYEKKGKSRYYDELLKKDLKVFQEKTVINDIVAINKLLSLNLTDARVNLCAKKDLSANNKEETLLLNIKKVLISLQKKYEHFELITNEVSLLSNMLTKNYEQTEYRKYKIDGEGLLGSRKTRVAREDLEELIALYNKTLKSKKYEVTILISNFYVDFINMKIFDGNNELIGLFLLYTLLFKNFEVFKYVSFFSHFLKVKEGFSHSLNQANYNWSTNFSQTDSMSEIIYSILLSSYEELEELQHQYSFEKDLNKSDSLENSILKFRSLFSKEDLRKKHPTVSESTINRALQRLKDEGKIKPISAGRSSKWQVLEGSNKSFSQLSIFETE